MRGFYFKLDTLYCVTFFPLLLFLIPIILFSASHIVARTLKKENTQIKKLQYNQVI